MQENKEELPKSILIEDLGMLFASDKSKRKVRFGLFICGFCGTNFKAIITSVKCGDIKSCGCYRKRRASEAHKTHGLGYTRLYLIWSTLKDRVLNPKNKAYKNYGGRGITLCDEWLDVQNFYDWAISNDYSEGLSIDRIDNDGNYEPNNCRWTTRIIQNRNQRLRKDNKSGYKGVIYHKSTGKYQASVSDGKQKYLGLYLTAEDGAVAYNNYIIANDLEGFPLNKLPDSHIHLQLSTKPHHQTL